MDQQLRAIYAGAANLRERRALAEKVTASLPELSHSRDRPARPDTAGVARSGAGVLQHRRPSNVGTEAINMLNKKARRTRSRQGRLATATATSTTTASARVGCQRHPHPTRQQRGTLTTLNSEEALDGVIRQDPLGLDLHLRSGQAVRPRERTVDRPDIQGFVARCMAHGLTPGCSSPPAGSALTRTSAGAGSPRHPHAAPAAFSVLSAWAALCGLRLA